jgi:hypothetical protein
LIIQFFYFTEFVYDFCLLFYFKTAGSKISLISNVWTTKGGLKAFLGISSCYITNNWQYQCQHLAIKYISWHHKGVFLASPFAHVLIKHNIHNKVSVLFPLHGSISYLFKSSKFLFLIQYIIGKTMDSGSNNLTMAKELSHLIQEHKGTFWDHAANHNRCFCHVLALILGAGLASLKLSTSKGPTTRKPEGFPILETITKEGELIGDGTESEEEEEINPDDVDLDLEDEEGGHNEDETETSSQKKKGKYAASGIGFTLKKVRLARGMCVSVC